MIVLAIDRMNATTIAAPNPEKPNVTFGKVLPELTKIDVNSNIIPLITKLKRPSVKNVIGNERICKMGFTSTFKIDKTILATKATKIPST